MRRRVLAVFTVLHGFAHAGVGMWARGPEGLTTALWVGALAGWMTVGWVVARGERASRVRACTLASLVCSLLLIACMPRSAVALVGVVISLGLGWSVMRGLRLNHDSAPTPRACSRRDWAAVVFVLVITAVIVARPHYMRWGTTVEERAMVLVTDPIPLTRATYRIDHAVTIHASAEEVFPWLAQMGQDRAGFYSYDWLERLAGADIHNTNALVPAWQQRKVGDLVRAVQPSYFGGVFGRDLGWRIERFDPPVAMVLAHWGAFVVVPRSARETRLIVRTLGSNPPSVAAILMAPFGLFLFEPMHFVMQRRMLLGIQERAERTTAMRRSWP